MKKLYSIAVFILLIAFSTYSQDTTTVIIFHTNDMHGRLKNFPKAKAIIDSVRNIYQDVFVLSAGDIFTGNPVTDKFVPDTIHKKTNLYYGYPIVDMMNIIGYNVSEIGNHEFDYTIPVFKERMKQAKFPFICANMDGADTNLYVKPYIILTTHSNLKIFVLGLLQLGKNGYPDSYIPKIKPIHFYKPSVVIKRYTNAKDSVNAMILLSHLGSDTDVVVASRTPIFDVIIGGHTHQVVDTTVGNTLVVQAGKYMRKLGMITLKFVNGHIVSKNEKLFDLNSYPKEDKELASIVEKYEKAPYLDKVIAIALRDLVGLNDLGKIITSAMLDYTKADMAFQNNGGIRIRQIPKGNITLRTIYAMSPFGNKYIVLQMTVSQIKDLIKYAYSLENKNELQAGGVEIKLDEKNGKLNKVKLYKDGKELTSGTYTVAINDYMFSAYKINYQKVTKKFEKPDAEIIIDYLKKIKKVK